MKTRSEWASRVSALSTRPYGGGSRSPASPISTRRGPSSPRCSQTLDDPGPPLNANVTGRLLGSTSSRVYAMTKISAFALWPSNLSSSWCSYRSTMRPAVAVLRTSWPPAVISCRVVTKSSVGSSPEPPFAFVSCLPSSLMTVQPTARTAGAEGATRRRIPRRDPRGPGDVTLRFRGAGRRLWAVAGAPRSRHSEHHANRGSVPAAALVDGEPTAGHAGNSPVADADRGHRRRGRFGGPHQRAVRTGRRLRARRPDRVGPAARGRFPGADAHRPLWTDGGPTVRADPVGDDGFRRSPARHPAFRLVPAALAG